MPKEMGGTAAGDQPRAAVRGRLRRLLRQRDALVGPPRGFARGRRGRHRHRPRPIGALGKGRFGLGVKLEVGVPALDQDAAEDLVARAHERCPYSNATRGNIDHEFEVTGGR